MRLAGRSTCKKTSDLLHGSDWWGYQKSSSGGFVSGFEIFFTGSGYSKKFQGCFGFAKIMLKKFFATKKINNGSILSALVFSVKRTN